MNRFAPERFAEHIERLALGIEPLDALRQGRAAHPLEITLDGVPTPLPRFLRRQRGLPEGANVLGRVNRHDSCLHALLHRDGMKSPVKLRFNDKTRRFVPRRISYAIPADIETPAPRVRRPVFFGGAAYDVSETATGLRGRVTWTAASDTPARWVRVEARLNGALVGYAHGDDRGEFLLLLRSTAGGLGGLPAPLRVLVTVFGPPAPPVPPTPALPKADPLWDLPLEAIGLPDPDDVSPGEKLPPVPFAAGDYAATADSTRANVTFRLGAIRTDEPKFFFMP
jgi:hypothetical protein